MGKKNPFVTTVGFNRHDPAHVEVAQLLNGMERGKAQYIVDAVMAYQSGGQAGVSVLSGTERMADYETIRKIVLQVMEIIWRREQWKWLNRQKLPEKLDWQDWMIVR